MKGAYLKNLTAAPKKSQSPIHPVPPNASLLPSMVIGLLPAVVQLTTRELTQQWEQMVPCWAEGWISTAPFQRQETIGSVHGQSQNWKIWSMKHCFKADPQQILRVPTIWHLHSDSNPRRWLVYIIGLLKQQIYKHKSSDWNIWVPTETLTGITFLFQIQNRLSNSGMMTVW